MTTTGFLHPGAMGATIAGACAGRRLWASERRSDATRARAVEHGIEDVERLEVLSAEADTIVSVCPPAQAFELARAVAATGFSGVYVDANAVSPATSRSIGALFDRFVDGGIVGPPVQARGTTRLYLAGPEAPAVASRWDGSHLEVRIIGSQPGAASAVKMAFAAWTKGTSALLLAVRALAEAEGVADDLLEEWATSMPELEARVESTASRIGSKAWRFVGEMEEIAATFAAAGLPDGFHHAAAEVYERLSGLRESPTGVTVDDVVGRLLNPHPEAQ